MRGFAFVVFLAACAHAPRAVGPAEHVTLGPAPATLVQAADGLAPWSVVVKDGRVLRARDAGLEDVSARYDVAGLRVVGVCALEGGAAFFAEQDTVLVTGGVARRYAVGGAAFACGGRSVARSDGHTLDVFDGEWTRYDARSARIAITGDGATWVARGRYLYRAQHGTLVLEHDAGSAIDALASVGGRLVLRQGHALSRFDGVRRIPLVGVDAAQMDRVMFAAPPAFTLAPIIAHTCGTCHRPGGRGPYDLRDEHAWLAHRDDIRRRVIEDRDMPPDATMLSDEERDVIHRWLDAQGR